MTGVRQRGIWCHTDATLESKRGLMSIMKRLRSEATQKKIQDAVVNLLLEKDYSEITISEISKACGINRTTFYLFYSSKEELVRDICSDFLVWYIEDLSQAYLADEKISKKIIIADFDKMKKNANLLKALFRIKTEHFVPYLELVTAIETAVRKKIPVSIRSEKADLVAKYYAANAAATVDWWTRNCDKYSTEFVYSIIRTSVCDGFIKLLD